MAAVAPPARYLKALWPDGELAEQYLPIWRLRGRHTFWVPTSDVDAALEVVGSNPDDLYVGMGLHPEPLGEGQRGGADTVSAIPGLWAEFDTSPDGPDQADILKLLDGLPLRPSMLVDSGSGGVHAYWLFREPWNLESATDRAVAAAMVKGWESYIHSRSEFGTFNAKKAQRRPVELLRLEDDHRFDPWDFEAYLPSDRPAAASALNGAQVRRWSPSFACPVCGSHPRLPQGQKMRCWGYLDSSSRYARCTRTDFAGGLHVNTDSTYSHRLDGPCDCGVEHQVSTVPARQFAARRPAALPAPAPALSLAEIQVADSTDFGFISDFENYAAHRLNTSASEQRLLGCVCVAAAVGSRLVSEMRWATKRANLWTLHVGPSGASKSTRLALPGDLIYHAAADRLLPSTSTPESLMELLRDLTPEQAADRLAAGGQVFRGAGVTFKDEYSSLLRQIQNPGYMAGAGESLIKLYDGDPVQSSTKAGGTVKVSLPCLTLVAGITPDMFASVVKPSLIGGGFMARHIHQLVPERELTASEMADSTVTSGRASLVVTLAELRHQGEQTAAAQWSRELLDRWDEYQAFLRGEAVAEERSEELGPYYQRYPEHVLKLAMLLSYTEGNRDGTVMETTYPITEAGLFGAIQIVEASRVAVRETVASLSDSLPIREARRVARWLSAHGGTATNRDVCRSLHWSAKDARDYRQTAEAHGLVVTGVADWTVAPA